MPQMKALQNHKAAEPCPINALFAPEFVA